MILCWGMVFLPYWFQSSVPRYVCCDRYIDILSSPTKKQSSEQLLHPYLAEDLGVVFECVGMILPVRKLKMIFSDR